MKCVAAGLVVALLALSAASADPIAQARTGGVQCYKPDTARKTCVALSSFVFDPSGTIINNGEMLLAQQPLIVIRTSNPVVIKGEAVCATARKEDIDTAQILVNGALLADDKAAPIRAQVAGAVQNVFGKEVCTTFKPMGDKLLTQVVIDGAPNPVYTQEVIWVSPDDGYKVAP